MTQDHRAPRRSPEVSCPRPDACFYGRFSGQRQAQISLATTRVGIIGTGGIAEFQGFAYAKVNNAKIEAVCDIDAGLAEKRAKQWGCTKVYTDYHQMLKDPAIDAVEILLPHQLHKQVVIDAAEAGKHISVMKPMALNAADSKEMIAAARKAS